MVDIFSKPSKHKTQSQGSKAYTESTLFPILPIEKLLPTIERNHYLKKLQEILTLPEDYFQEVYVDLIDHFALFVQSLPESYGEELGGLLNDGLRRGLLAIQVLNEKHESKPHPLFFFAIFSIALLADVGQILNYRVMISDEKGIFVDDWYPFLGPMSDFGDYFKLRPYEDTPRSLINSATPLFGRQLLSEAALVWLSSNNQIFDMWLAFLNKGEDWAGGLAKILKLERKDFQNRRDESGLVPVDVKLFDPFGTELGEEFLAWLKRGLRDGTISCNEADSDVHVVRVNDLDVSVFVEAPEIFKKYMHFSGKRQDWSTVFKQFNHLGLTRLSGDDVKFEQFFAEHIEKKAGKIGFLARAQQKASASQRITSAKNFREGVVIKDAKMLFGANVPGISQHLRSIEMRWGQENLLSRTLKSGSAPSQTNIK